MASRLFLHEVLCTILSSRNVYFQPPASVKMRYPAIVYHRNGYDTTKADNLNYLKKTKYKLTYIDPDPDSAIIDKIMDLPYTVYLTSYASDGLNHDTFEIYF